jgi:hypothetical protein
MDGISTYEGNKDLDKTGCTFMTIIAIPSRDQSAQKLLQIELRDSDNRPVHLRVSATEALKLLEALRDAERRHELRTRSLEEQAEALYAAREWI